ncbi:MAG: Hpt domain-containing protein [Candidatus Accumulibacter sp.]|jgi:chemosensory pili system protein ChpA (sensor histidine kinase/response regulator)|nr:Hpt domain-containing protein [Accumulibacter sp.]
MMNAATEFDVGPLTWVIKEIDLALERAVLALDEFAAGAASGAADSTQIKFCRTHLHQVEGALTIVGLDGVTQFVEALEGLLEVIEGEARSADDASIGLVRRALEAVGLYLGEVINGRANQPLRLLPLYREIQAERGVRRCSPADLFFPDLSIRPPRQRAPAAPLDDAERMRRLRQERSRFQRGLLSWLHAPEGHREGIREMLTAIKRIEKTQDTGTARAFWWVAGGLLTALDEGSVPDEASVKSLCSRIDMQIRRLLEGSKNVAERLMREVLYLIAGSRSDDLTVGQIKETYRLDALLPVEEATAVPDAAQVAIGRLREVISVLEEAWNKFCAGSAASLSVFEENAGLLSRLVEQTRHTDYRRLAQAVATVAHWLAETPARHSEALAMELATAILLVENARKNYPRLGADFAHQVDVTVERIHACMAGHPPRPGSETASLDEMSRRAQERLLIGQVAKEIQNNLLKVEQGLDGFFRDAEKRLELTGIENLLQQIVGALTVLRMDGAAAAVREDLETVRRFAAPDHVPSEEEFERLAGRLSMMGFFVEAMPRGAEDFESFVQQMRMPSREEADSAKEEDSSVEREVVQSRRETHALLEALKEQPEDAGLREEIRQNLKTLKSDADLVADTKLGEQAKAMLNVLASDTDVAPRIKQAMAVLKPEAAPPSRETLQLSQASSEEIDAELFGIFLDEVREVMATVEENLSRLENEPRDGASLTPLRRSFHTLKGSGRMVGLKDLGEAAWAIEQTLNLWLRLERAADADLVGLLDEAYGVFTEWVRHLETPASQAPDPQEMIARAAALRASAETVRPPEERGERARDAAPLRIDPAPASSEESAVLPAASVDAEEFEFAPVSSEETTGLPAVSAESEEFEFAPVRSEETSNLLAASVETEEFEFAPVSTGETADLPTASTEAEEAPAVVEKPSAAEVIPLFPASTETAGSTPAQAAAGGEPRVSQPSIVISPALFAIFLEEAKTYLHTLHRELPALESEDARPTPQEMYRAAHTLAGISATVGLSPINQLGHALEHALLRRDRSRNPGSVQALATVHRTIGELESMLSALPERRDVALPPGLIEELDGLYPVSGEETAEAIPPDATEEAKERVPEVPPAAPVGDEIDAQLLPIFLEEAVDLTRAIAGQLRAWRAGTDDGEAVRVLARQLHTLKGSARMAGAMTLGEITHALEARVDRASQAGTASTEVIDGIESDFEAIRQIIERLQRGEAMDAEDGAPEDAGPATDESDASGQAEALEDGDRRRASRPRPAEAESDAQARAMLRVRVNVVDRLVNEAGELSIARSRIEGEMRGMKESLLDLTENVLRLRRQLREIEIQAESRMQAHTTTMADEKHAGFDPLEFDRFTRFQELTRMMAESVNDVATVQQHLLKNLDDANAALGAQARQNREVQQELMSMRMIPFDSLADRLYRVLRQASKDLDKRANMEIRGGHVELDRSVLDKISAPLEHLLRNAVAHGIERRDERIAHGKPEIGEILLSLKQEGNEVTLTLSDDGAGLDYARIRERAVVAGLIGASEAADEARLAEFIFAPGFSTAEALSQTAGRGVGMDVVKTEIARLGGRVEVESRPGQGSEFRLILPLTLVVTKALLIRAGDKTFAIPSSMIEQVLDLREEGLVRLREAGHAEWQANTYPFSYLPHLLGERSAFPEPRRRYWVLLLRGGARRLAIQVDELIGNQEIVVKNVGEQLARVVGVDGATVLGDGQVVLILNPVALSTRAPAETAGLGQAAEPAQAKPPTVMVVDDSLTVRKITGRLMTREGYQVILARDGVEALEILLDTVPDVMLVDIEMPRMDGFDLTRHVRADARVKDVPIIMITSRTAEKHRHYAFEIGVNHYLGKPYQEEELVQLVGKYMEKRKAENHPQ